MKWLLSIAVLMAVAIGSYQFGRNSQAPAQQVKKDLINLTRADFEEYQSLKTMEEKYKKADEILGKIVLVFLADLGVRLSFQPAPALVSNCAPSAKKLAPRTPASTAEDIQKKYHLSDTSARMLQWKRDEDTLMASSNEPEALEHLKKLEIKDFSTNIKNAPSIGSGNIREISGTYRGDITFSDKKKHETDWILEWTVLMDNDRMGGNASMNLTRKNDNVTFSRGSGDITNVFSRSGSSEALIVNVYNEKGYIQIYPFQKGETWIGNYYEKEKSGQYIMSGQVSLHRIR